MDKPLLANEHSSNPRETSLNNIEESDASMPTTGFNHANQGGAPTAQMFDRLSS